MNTLSHIAIIMDGNGRWAAKKKKSRKFGHLYGAKNIEKIAKFCIKKNISYLTLFAFSSDNWARPKLEISNLFFLFEEFFKKNLNRLLESNLKIKFIGENKNLPSKIKKIKTRVENLSKNNNGLNLIIALNYSSKNELINCFKKILKNKKKIKQINIDNINKNLYTNEIPDPDILIRTGGHKRLSNFLLWQISYTELFFIKKLWPDFNANDLNLIISKFSDIKRNFGGL